MRITLNLAQATALIDAAEMSSLPIINDPKLELPIDAGIGEKISPRIALAGATIVLKTAVQEELQSTQIRFDSIIKELQDHGYTEVTEELTTVKLKIEAQGSKTHDKYFDENGQIKPKGL